MTVSRAPDWTHKAFVPLNGGKPAKAAEGAAPVEPSRPLRVEPPKMTVNFEQWQAVISGNFPGYARPPEICASSVCPLCFYDLSQPCLFLCWLVPCSVP